MRLPVIHGIIDRRILVNYRVEPEALARLLPPPFRPQLVGGCGVAGICLIRLRGIRPWFVPGPWGINSENAAHRIAVAWDDVDGPHTGVYVPRRDTSAWINTLAGGRLFPGVHHRARFDVAESGDDFSVAMTSLDGTARVAVFGRVASDLPPGSVFASLEAASGFFRGGSLGYSPNGRPGCCDGMELRTEGWKIEPLDVRHVESSFFNDPARFPPGTAEFDSAFLMRGLEHTWHARPTLGSGGDAGAA